MTSTLTFTIGTKVYAFKGTHKKFRGEVKSNPQKGKVLVANPRQEKWILLSDLRVSESEPFSLQVKILGEKPRVIDVDEELPIYRECQPDEWFLILCWNKEFSSAPVSQSRKILLDLRKAYAFTLKRMQG